MSQEKQMESIKDAIAICQLLKEDLLLNQENHYIIRIVNVVIRLLKSVISKETEV